MTRNVYAIEGNCTFRNVILISSRPTWPKYQNFKDTFCPEGVKRSVKNRATIFKSFRNRYSVKNYVTSIICSTLQYFGFIDGYRTVQCKSSQSRQALPIKNDYDFRRQSVQFHAILAEFIGLRVFQNYKTSKWQARKDSIRNGNGNFIFSFCQILS